MPNVNFTIQGLDELRVKLAHLANPSQFRELVHGAGLLIKSAFKEYPTRKSPTRKSVYGTTFKSDKQRRWFFWAMRANAIDVPYRRGQSPGTYDLQHKWTTRMISDTAVEIGAKIPYGPLLMDATQQTKYAAAVGWRTVQTILPEVEPQVKAALEAGISKILGV